MGTDGSGNYPIMLQLICGMYDGYTGNIFKRHPFKKLQPVAIAP